MVADTTPIVVPASRNGNALQQLRDVGAWLESYRPGCILGAFYDARSKARVVRLGTMTEDAWDGALAVCGARHSAKLLVGDKVEASAILWCGVHLVATFLPGTDRGWPDDTLRRMGWKASIATTVENVEVNVQEVAQLEVGTERLVASDDGRGILVENILP